MLCATFPYLLNIDPRCAFEHLIDCQLPLYPAKLRQLYLHHCSISFPRHQSAHYPYIQLFVLLTSSFQNLPRSLSAIRQRQVDNLIVSREFDLKHHQPILRKLHLPISITHILQDDQRTVHTSNGVVTNPGGNIVRWRLSWVSHDCYWGSRGRKNSRSFTSDLARSIAMGEESRGWWGSFARVAGDLSGVLWRSSSLAQGRSDKRMPTPNTWSLTTPVSVTPLHSLNNFHPSSLSSLESYSSLLQWIGLLRPFDHVQFCHLFSFACYSLWKASKRV